MRELQLVVGADAVGGELQRTDQLSRDGFARLGEFHLGNAEIGGSGAVDRRADAAQRVIAALAHLAQNARDRRFKRGLVVPEQRDDFRFGGGQRALVGAAAGEQRGARLREAAPDRNFGAHAASPSHSPSARAVRSAVDSKKASIAA